MNCAWFWNGELKAPPGGGGNDAAGGSGDGLYASGLDLVIGDTVEFASGEKLDVGPLLRGGEYGGGAGTSSCQFDNIILLSLRGIPCTSAAAGEYLPPLSTGYPFGPPFHCCGL